MGCRQTCKLLQQWRRGRAKTGSRWTSLKGLSYEKPLRGKTVGRWSFSSLDSKYRAQVPCGSDSEVGSV